ncbi:MAG: hypothetical protein ACXVWW_11280 [Nocardioides sp.]
MNDLNSLMHASVDGERPDVDRLLAGAIRDGQRLQRRRRMSYAGVGLAVAAIASAGAVVAGTQAGSGTARDDLAPAASGPANASPTGPAPLRAGQTFDLGQGVTGTVVACTSTKPSGEAGVSPDCVLPKKYAIVGSSTIPGPGTGFAVVLVGPAAAIEDSWSSGFDSPQLAAYQGLTYALPASDPLIQPIYQGQDVAVHVPGWKLVGPVADDKATLEGPHGAVAGIVWRAAKDYAAWAGQPDKGADPLTWTSEVHDGVFVTIQGGQGTTDAEIQALGASLTWTK